MIVQLIPANINLVRGKQDNFCINSAQKLHTHTVISILPRAIIEMVSRLATNEETLQS